MLYHVPPTLCIIIDTGTTTAWCMQKGRVKSNGFGGHRLFCVKYACIELEIEEVSDDIMSDVIRSTYKPQCKDLLRRQV